ncbi:branched-chain amino acid ABC transporter permease [Allostella vacuolata]|nr:branched-chain amino acid ABC transporter permease [Stella vacuolata]
MTDASLSPLALAPRAGGRPLAIAAAVVAVLALVPLVIADKFILSLGSTVFITAIAAASLHLIIRTGHISLGHAAFMGIGAYASVLTVMELGLPFAAGVLAAFVAPCLLALAIGPLVLRLTGKYFVLVTFLFGEIVRMVFVEWKSVTGGANGIFGIPAPAPVFNDPAAYYYLSLGAGVLLVGFIARLLASEVGRAIDAVRESERLAHCSGIPVLRLKVTIFALGCGIVGIAGALQGHFIRYVDPTSYSVVQSLNLVVVNVIGGMQTLVGPLVGTLFYLILPEMLRGYVELQRIIFGIILIIVMAFLPGGLVELGGRALQLVRRRAGS